MSTMSTLSFSLIAEIYNDHIEETSSRNHSINEPFWDSLSDEEREFVKEAVLVINKAWMIYTCDHSYEFQHDVKSYNEIALSFNETYGEMFNLYTEKTHLQWQELFPEGFTLPFIIMFGY